MFWLMIVEAYFCQRAGNSESVSQVAVHCQMRDVCTAVYISS